MCDWCQGSKGKNYMTGDGKKKYIHPYFDKVDKPLFSIVFTKPFITPIIGISINKELPIELQSLVETHLEGIGFSNRFIDYFKTKYLNILRTAKEFQHDRNHDIEDCLKNFLKLEEKNSINSWNAVLYRSILQCADLMSFLKTGDLPDNL